MPTTLYGVSAQVSNVSIPLVTASKGYNGGGMDGNNSKWLLDRLDAFVQLLLPETAPIIAVICSLRDVFQGVNHQSSLHLLKVNKADRHKTDGPTNRQSGL